MRQHVPKDRGDSPHDCDAGDLGAATHFDSAIPSSHLRVVFQEVQNQLPQDEASELASLFGNGA